MMAMVLHHTGGLRRRLAKFSSDKYVKRITEMLSSGILKRSEFLYGEHFQGSEGPIVMEHKGNHSKP